MAGCPIAAAERLPRVTPSLSKNEAKADPPPSATAAANFFSSPNKKAVPGVSVGVVSRLGTDSLSWRPVSGSSGVFCASVAALWPCAMAKLPPTSTKASQIPLPTRRYLLTIHRPVWAHPAPMALWYPPSKISVTFSGASGRRRRGPPAGTTALRQAQRNRNVRAPASLPRGLYRFRYTRASVPQRGRSPVWGRRQGCAVSFEESKRARPGWRHAASR